MTEAHSDSVTFASLGLQPAVMEGVRQAGFTHCTPIQAQTLPIALTGRDVAGQAQTGTGKTAAFLVALYQTLLTHPPASNRSGTSVRALIVAPTRELAVQIHHDALTLGAHTGLRHTVVFGGIDYEKQRQELRDGCEVLIGTPGRLIDYFKQHVFDLRHAQVLVLDEADRMFDLGFIADIRYILRRLPHPERRQSMLFSATLSHRVLELAYEHMNNPELVRIEPDKMTVDEVRQLMYYPSMEEKVPLLIGLLHQSEAVRTMVFVNTKRTAERLESTLKANGFSAQALSGDVPQNKRLRFLRDFHEGKLAVLIATDVASRGLHIPDVSHVFNFDLPQDAPDYVHRIGRTARAGAEGDAISFACEEYAVSLPEIESYVGHKIPFSPIAPELLATGVVAGAVSHSHRPRPGGPRRHGGGPPRGHKGPPQRAQRRRGR
jgi:ATP-dependent RNA helicase RhlB